MWALRGNHECFMEQTKIALLWSLTFDKLKMIFVLGRVKMCPET